MSTPLLIAIIILSSLTVLLFIFTYYTYYITFKRWRRPIDIERDLGLKIDNYDEIKRTGEEFSKQPYEKMRIKSDDGLILVGRYYHVNDGAPVDILFHGYRSSPTHDFPSGLDLSFDGGHNVLLVYHRSHGKSEGKSITFGAKEKFDLLLWVNHIIKRFGDDTEIILTGISMGAATVILASALELPKNVKGIIADCPYSSAKEEIMQRASSMGFPASVVYPIIRLGGIVFARFDPNSPDVVEAARKSRLPILLIHGDCDSFVPKYMSDRIYEANPSKISYHVFPHADHGLSYITDPERYGKICHEFCNECLSKKYAN